MHIKLNGENYPLADSVSLKKLTAGLNLQNKKFAIEVNQQIIPRGKHDSFLLTENDEVEIVHAIGGG